MRHINQVLGAVGAVSKVIDGASLMSIGSSQYKSKAAIQAVPATASDDFTVELQASIASSGAQEFVPVNKLTQKASFAHVEFAEGVLYRFKLTDGSSVTVKMAG